VLQPKIWLKRLLFEPGRLYPAFEERLRSPLGSIVSSSDKFRTAAVGALFVVEGEPL